jgi:hypothetical protein
MSRFQDEVDKIQRLEDDLLHAGSQAGYMVALGRLVRANTQLLILIAKTLGQHEIHADES